MRDIQLDIYRALAMIYIICVIHIVYWLGIGDEPIKSLILFEMPVIFFISGASFSLQSKDRDFKTTLISRFKRVVMPYYVYAIIVLVISITCLLIGTTWMGYELPTISFKQVLNMLLCGGVDGFPFNSHMWFIKPYFLLSISFCFQKKIIEKSRIGGGYFLLCIIAFLIVTEIPFLKKITQLSNLFGYNVFLVAGYLFYKKVSVVNRLLIIAILSVFILTLSYCRGDFFPMYDNKYPMNVNFIVYGLFVLTTFSVLLHYIRFRPNAVFDMWNKKGYTMYLYQNVVYSLSLYFVINPMGFLNNTIYGFVMCSTVIFVVSMLFSVLTFKIEEFILKFINGLFRS